MKNERVQHCDTLRSQFIQFSYTTKLKIVLFFGYLPCLVIFLIAAFIYSNPFASLKTELIGIDYVRKLNIFTRSVLNYQKSVTWDKKSSEITSSDIDLYYDELMQHQRYIRNKIVNTNDKIQELLDENLQILKDYWFSLKNSQGYMKADQINGILEAYDTLMNYMSIETKLLLNPDQATSVFVYGITRNIPTQLILAASSLNFINKNTEALDYEQLGALKSIRHSMQSNLIYFKDSFDDIFENQPTNFAGELKLALKKDMETYTASLMMLDKLIENRLISQAKIVKNEQPDVASIISTSFTLSNRMNDQVDAWLLQQQATIQIYIFWTLFLPFIGGILVALFYLTRFVRLPLKLLYKTAEKFAEGDFKARVPITSQDEAALLSQAFNETAEHFDNIFSKAKNVTSQLAVTTGSFLNYTKDLEANPAIREKAIKDANFNMRTILRNAHEFAEDIQKIGKNASLTEFLAATGKANLHEMETIMQLMLTAASNIVSTLSALQDKVGNIEHVIETIIKIADQSNLLSLNTAVRASKSGGQGRGFKIIAEKIRDMANQVALATLDIENIIQDIIETVTDTVKKVDEFSTDIGKQVKDTTEINEELSHLMANTQDQIRNFKDINSSMQKQMQEISHINRMMIQLHHGTEHTTKSVHALNTEVEYLYNASSNLNELSNKFQLTRSIPEVS